MFVSRWPNTYYYHVRNWDTTSITYSRSTCWSNFLMLMYDVNVSRNWYTTSITYCCFNHALLRESLQKMLSESGKQVNAESTWCLIKWGEKRNVLDMEDEDYCHSTDECHAHSVWFQCVFIGVKALKESRWANW